SIRTSSPQRIHPTYCVNLSPRRTTLRSGVPPLTHNGCQPDFRNKVHPARTFRAGIVASILSATRLVIQSLGTACSADLPSSPPTRFLPFCPPPCFSAPR